MARNTLELETGDKIVILTETSFGLKIKFFGILMGMGYGRAVRNHSPGNRCEDGFMDEWNVMKENSRYCVVAVPVYRKDDGIIEWRPYSTQKSNIMLDRQSVRDMDEATRTKIKDSAWMKRMGEIATNIEREVAHEIVRTVFGSTYVSTEVLSKLLLEKGIHPPVDMDERLNMAVAKALKEFNREQLDKLPTDF